jgi:hypothetical protein
MAWAQEPGTVEEEPGTTHGDMPMGFEHVRALYRYVYAEESSAWAWVVRLSFISCLFVDTTTGIIVQLYHLVRPSQRDPHTTLIHLFDPTLPRKPPRLLNLLHRALALVRRRIDDALL